MNASSKIAELVRLAAVGEDPPRKLLELRKNSSSRSSVAVSLLRSARGGVEEAILPKAL
jgi:hypothetical protein